MFLFSPSPQTHLEFSIMLELDSDTLDSDVLLDEELLDEEEEELLDDEEELPIELLDEDEALLSNNPTDLSDANKAFN